jgi:uncharacterized protein with HEPN domain
MKRDDRVYLLHILDAVKQIEHYVQGLNHETFMQSRLVQDGVIRQLEIIGEATKNLSVATTGNSPEVPWRDMAGMRDVLIHQYFGVDLSAVWDTVKQDIPELKQCLAKLIESS